MKKLKKNLFVPLFIAFIMIMSTLGFIYGGEGSKKYDGYTFKQGDQGWIAFIEKTNSYQTFTYLPNEVESLGRINFNSDFVYIVDKGYGVHDYRLKNIFTSAGVISQMASFDENSSLSVVDCNADFPVIILNDSSANTEVYKENNCIHLNGNLNKAIDFLAYVVFGVIK